MAIDTLKDHIKETSLFSSRIIAALVFILVMIGILLGRMVYLQIYSHGHYATLSQNNRVTVQPIPPTRGLIYDRNGVVLAQNIPSFTLEIIPAHIDDLDATLAELGEIIEISDASIKDFHKLRRRSSRFKPVPLRYRLTEEETARFAARGHLFPGVEIHARLMRHYPNGASGVHALGYVGRINEKELQTFDTANYNGTTHVGKNGIERHYEDQLHGKVGYRRVETNAKGRIIRVLEEQPPEPGQNLILNMDSKVQKVAEDALGDNRGTIVVVNVKTGGVIALASMPHYDPNLFVNGIDTKSYAALTGSPDQPLFNRAIRGLYPPGSTIKPLIGLGGLEYDIIHPGSHIDCKGWYSLKNDDHKYRDWKRTGHGDTTLRSAINESCDVFFYDLALDMGIDKIHQYLAQFGLGKRTDIDIGGETSGLLPSREWKRRVKKESWYPGETLITGIGQGFNLTSPLQLATSTATLANLGQPIVPRLGLALEDSQTKLRTPIGRPSLPAVEIVDPEHWTHVIASMKDVVHSPRGTARGISRKLPYTIAGKTGTAQVFGIKQDEKYVKEDIDERLHDHALFVAFAPLEDPEIAIAVIVENGGSGGTTAAPVARKVMDQYLLGKTQ
jgi:penicillin-binding protein 2